MAQLIVRNIEEDLVRALKELAGRHGHSAEEEHRRILSDALLRGDADPKEVLLDMPNVGEDSDFARISDGPRPVDL